MPALAANQSRGLHEVPASRFALRGGRRGRRAHHRRRQGAPRPPSASPGRGPMPFAPRAWRPALAGKPLDAASDQPRPRTRRRMAWTCRPISRARWTTRSISSRSSPSARSRRPSRPRSSADLANRPRGPPVRGAFALSAAPLDGSRVIAGVVLAAGLSRRMGRRKLLLDLGRPAGDPPRRGRRGRRPDVDEVVVVVPPDARGPGRRARGYSATASP